MALLTTDQYRVEGGPYLTKALFYELSDHPQYVQFTVKEQDHKVTETNKDFGGRLLPSLQRIFVEHVLYDPTEVGFADHVFGLWDPWDRICQSPTVLPHIEKWRREADIRRKALAFQQIVSEAANGGKSAMAAAKFLIDEPWKVKDARTKDGRAARKEVRETAEEAFKRTAIEDDLKRLRDEGIIQ